MWSLLSFQGKLSQPKRLVHRLWRWIVHPLSRLLSDQRIAVLSCSTGKSVPTLFSALESAHQSETPVFLLHLYKQSNYLQVQSLLYWSHSSFQLSALPVETWSTKVLSTNDYHQALKWKTRFDVLESWMGKAVYVGVLKSAFAVLNSFQTTQARRRSPFCKHKCPSFLQLIQAHSESKVISS